jgi:hypothetical protein
MLRLKDDVKIFVYLDINEITLVKCYSNRATIQGYFDNFL